MTSTDHPKSGCFSGVLSCLLCSGSLQTYPSDQITDPKVSHFDDTKTEPTSTDEAKLQAAAAASSSPGIVAKLMGLDSLPESNWVPKGKTPDSVTRSRSVNFMDYLLEFDPKDTQHRVVRTSVSFREAPSALQHQQERDFLFLYLDKSNGKREMGSRSRKSEMSFEELKQRKAERTNKEKEINKREKVGVINKKNENQRNHSKKVSKFKDEPRRVCNSNKRFVKVGNFSGAEVSGFVSPCKKDVQRKSGLNSMEKSHVKPTNQNEVLVERNFTQKGANRPKNKEAEPEFSSENSSPVSVLDHDDFLIHDESSLPEDSRSMDFNSKRKSSQRTTSTSQKCPSPHADRIFKTVDLELRTASKGDHYESINDQETQSYYIELVGMLCKLTEEDIMKKSNWVARKEFKFENFEEICMEFGKEILDQILHQMVDELVGFHLENVACNA